MRLYIANPTNQNRRIAYRLDYSVDEKGNRFDSKLVPYKTHNIPPGRQEQVGGDLHISQVEEIIRQLSPYGLTAMMEMKTAKARGKVPMIFNLDKVVPAAIMRDAQEHNASVMSGDGESRRRQAAIAVNNALDGQVSGQGIPDVKPPGKLEVEYEQVSEDENYADARLEEGLRVVRAHNKPPTTPKPRRRPQRKAA